MTHLFVFEKVFILLRLKLIGISCPTLLGFIVNSHDQAYIFLSIIISVNDYN